MNGHDYRQWQNIAYGRQQQNIAYGRQQQNIAYGQQQQNMVHGQQVQQNMVHGQQVQQNMVHGQQVQQNIAYGQQQNNATHGQQHQYYNNLQQQHAQQHHQQHVQQHYYQHLHHPHEHPNFHLGATAYYQYQQPASAHIAYVVPSTATATTNVSMNNYVAASLPSSTTSAAPSPVAPSSTPSMLPPIAVIATCHSPPPAQTSACTSLPLAPQHQLYRQQHHQQLRKQRPPPQPQSCEPCGKRFENEKSYANHCQQHVSCSQEGCAYAASKTLVVRHEREVHAVVKGKKDGVVGVVAAGVQAVNVPHAQRGTKRKAEERDADNGNDNGNDNDNIPPTDHQLTTALRNHLAAKPLIRTMDTAEEIERWRAERARNYPTAAMVARKEAERQERMARATHSERIAMERKEKMRLRELANAFVLGQSQDERLCAGGDDAMTVPGVSSFNNGTPDTADDSDAPPEEESVKRNNDHDKRKNISCRNFVRGKCRMGANCPYRHSLTHKTTTIDDAARKKKSVMNLPKRGNLYEMLVKTEVERERSAIFQAIDYIVESDFFEGGNVDDNVAHVVDDHEDEQDEEDDDASSNSESTDVDDDDDDDTDSTDDLINDDDDLELDDDPDIPPPASTMAPISLADSLN